MLSDEIKSSIDNSVLCWLATVSTQQIPNVSPKEIFTYQGESTLLIANIASPKSVINIASNANVCISFIDIFKQKGFKLVGQASIVDRLSQEFNAKYQLLHQIAGDEYPIHSVISVEVTKSAPIIAPRYKLFPDTTEQEQIDSAMKTYGVAPNTK
jgi:predicted pyridoxine 5'-phosphate oxidase superfamily flavin-nucleotide-binding protein